MSTHARTHTLEAAISSPRWRTHVIPCGEIMVIGAVLPETSNITLTNIKITIAEFTSKKWYTDVTYERGSTLVLDGEGRC